MDPVTAAGLALGVASIALQVYTGIVQGIQMLVTALDYPDYCRYLNLRLRMEQQRLFAWSETSGLLDLDAKSQQRVLESNTFVLHRQTVLDLLVQVQCLFDEFRRQQEKHKNLRPVADPARPAPSAPRNADFLEKPEKDAAEANVPLPRRRRDFIRKAMLSLRKNSHEAARRLQWVSFDKAAFELLLAKFSQLNDNMTDILDTQMQKEIHLTVQDTNRGVLQLHHRIADLARLVMALNLKLEAASSLPPPYETLLPSSSPQEALLKTPVPESRKQADADGLQMIAQLAKFKAFNEAIESDKQTTPWDEAAAMYLELGPPDDQRRDLLIGRSSIQLDVSDDELVDLERCEATLQLPDGSQKRVMVEFKDHEPQSLSSYPSSTPPPKDIILDRVRKLAALLNRTPKPRAFRTLHCLGYFDLAAAGNPRPSGEYARRDGGASDDEDEDEDEDEDDIRTQRLGLVFERPQDGGDVHPTLPPVTLRQLYETQRKPRVTHRVQLACALANCLLYLHAVDWLHKGLRSHNVLFYFRGGEPGQSSSLNTSPSATNTPRVDYARPYLAGFDFSRPARPEEMTELPADDAEYNLYRHPRAQAPGIYGDQARRERFKKSFDMYSLGVLFVEIAHWAPVERVLGLRTAQQQQRPLKPSAALRVRESLLATDCMADVGAAMGAVFEAATRRCVAGGRELGLNERDNETDDAVAARLSMAFYEDVVKKLGEVKV